MYVQDGFLAHKIELWISLTSTYWISWVCQRELKVPITVTLWILTPVSQIFRYFIKKILGRKEHNIKKSVSIETSFTCLHKWTIPAVTNFPEVIAQTQVWVLSSNLYTFLLKIWVEDRVEWCEHFGDDGACCLFLYLLHFDDFCGWGGS